LTQAIEGLGKGKGEVIAVSTAFGRRRNSIGGPLSVRHEKRVNAFTLQRRIQTIDIKTLGGAGLMRRGSTRRIDVGIHQFLQLTWLIPSPSFVLLEHAIHLPFTVVPLLSW
jgi:hypothetical protein